MTKHLNEWFNKNIYYIFSLLFFCYCLFRVENSSVFQKWFLILRSLCFASILWNKSNDYDKEKKTSFWFYLIFFFTSRCSFLHICKLHANWAQANSLSFFIWFYRYKRFLLLLEFSFENCAQSINCLILIACTVPFAFDECFCFCFSFHHFLSIFLVLLFSIKWKHNNNKHIHNKCIYNTTRKGKHCWDFSAFSLWFSAIRSSLEL